MFAVLSTTPMIFLFMLVMQPWKFAKPCFSVRYSLLPNGIIIGDYRSVWINSCNTSFSEKGGV